MGTRGVSIKAHIQLKHTVLGMRIEKWFRLLVSDANFLTVLTRFYNAKSMISVWKLRFLDLLEEADEAWDSYCLIIHYFHSREPISGSL